MVAPRYPLHVVYYPVPSQPQPPAQRMAGARDLVPWADPYIALLIRRLQDEIRAERREQRDCRQTSDGLLRQEAEPASLDEPLDFEFPDSPNWSNDNPPIQPR